MSFKSQFQVYEEVLSGLPHEADERDSKAIGAVLECAVPIPLTDLAECDHNQALAFGVAVDLTPFTCYNKIMFPTLITNDGLVLHEHVQRVDERDVTPLVSTATGHTGVRPGGHLPWAQLAQFSS